MKTCLMISPNATDGVSLYRHWGPMIDLEKRGWVKLLTLPDDIKHTTHWHYYKKADFLFINRPTRVQDKAAFDEAKKYDLPIWLDMDDNCFRIPDDNDAFAWFNDQAQGILAYCTKNADVVTVATQTLKDFLKAELNVDALLIPNALDDDLLKYKRSFSPTSKTVWRGSKAGLAAVLYYSEAIEQMVRETVISGMSWQFFGLNPFFINRHFKPHPIKWQNPVNFIDYIGLMNKSNASFCIMTHLGTEFDKNKSINGWLEASLVGQVCLVPDFGQWCEIPEGMVIKYKPMDSEDFYQKYKTMISMDQSDLNKMAFNSFNYIESNYLLSIINKSRIKLIEDLLNGKKR